MSQSVSGKVGNGYVIYHYALHIYLKAVQSCHILYILILGAHLTLEWNIEVHYKLQGTPIVLETTLVEFEMWYGK